MWRRGFRLGSQKRTWLCRRAKLGWSTPTERREGDAAGRGGDRQSEREVQGRGRTRDCVQRWKRPEERMHFATRSNRPAPAWSRSEEPTNCGLGSDGVGGCRGPDVRWAPSGGLRSGRRAQVGSMSSARLSAHARSQRVGSNDCWEVPLWWHGRGTSAGGLRRRRACTRFDT